MVDQSPTQTKPHNRSAENKKNVASKKSKIGLFEEEELILLVSHCDR